MRRLLFFVFVFVTASVHAQYVSGPTPVTVGETQTYTFNNGTIYMAANWASSLGSVVTKWSSGTNYYATIQWNTPGTANLSFLDQTYTQRGSLSVTVNVGAPNTTFTTVQNCNSSVVTRNTSPGSGVNWYWQTTSSGTSTTLGNGASITRTTTGALWLRAQSISSGGWSTSSQSVGTVTVVSPLAVPASSTNGDVISNASSVVPVSVSTVSGATSYRWYSVSSGGSIISGSPATNSYSPTLASNSTATYYVESVIGNCPSTTRKSVVASVYPEPVLSVTNSGIVDVSDPVTLSVSNYTYGTYAWLDGTGAVISGATSATYTTNIADTYKVRVIKGNSTSFTSTSGVPVTNPYNFIISSDILADNITSEGIANTLAASKRSVTVQYFDGLGRPIQTVVKKGTPDSLDIVTPNVYDQYGREINHYLPFASSQSNGHFKDNTTLFAADGDYTHNFYKNASSNIAYDTKPFAKSTYDDSPLIRALISYGPGSDWHTNNKFVQSQDLVNVYGTAASQDQIILWSINVSSLPVRNISVNAGFYPSGTLSVSSTIDEQGNEVRLYTNRLGNMVLKMNYLQGSKTDLTSIGSADNWSRTYYIYDDLNNLRFVLQPELSKVLVQNSSYNPTQTDLDNFAFQYTYDSRHRQIQKQIPGAGIVYMVYDYRDRIVLTQDANQRNLGTTEWSFIKYDVLNRPVLTGRYANASITQAAMQAQVDAYYNNLTASQAWYETYIGSTAGNVLGYDNKSFPQTTVLNDYGAATYYDNYDAFIAPTGYTYLNESLPGQATANNTRVKGLVTGVQTRNLTTNVWIRNVNYYDAKYRVTQTMGDHQKGTVRTSMVYDFPGRLLISKRSYVVNGVTTTIKETFTYDNASRLLTVKHSINGATDVMVVKNEYNQLGQLTDKRLHSIDNGVTFKQSVDYRYNIRGWRTKINEADVSAIASGDASNDYFGMELAYNTSITNLTSTKSYNGNISAIQWSKGNGGTLKRQAYSFDYDNLNRLVNANHFDNKIIDNSWLSNKKAYHERNLTYDLNGNINKLVRYGFTGFTGTRMDSLFYNYTGNRLNGVIDYGDATTGFVNGTTGASTSDYSYDFNGNLKLDNNKGITAITYNYLNLPVQINKGATDYVIYTYDATGHKLAQQVYGSTPKTTDYIGELVFESNVLKSINHAEGRILPDGGGWEYQYYLKDHLENVRVTFTAKTQTTTNYTTNFEAATDSNFQNYSNNTFDLVDHTDAAGTVYQKTQLLNGGTYGRVGLAKSVAVLPGDQITFSAYVKYMDVGGANTNSLIVSLANAFGVSSGSTGDQLKAYNGLSSYAIGTGGHSTDDGSAPKAFITILFFDKDYNLVDAAWDQVSTIGAQTSGSVKQPPHDLVTVTAKAPEAGYAYAFFSNEHPTFMNVYFDDATFSYTPSPIVSVSDYFPFGMQFNSGERTGTGSLEQRVLYNGKELQDELSLNWYDYGARMYMPEIGRWGVVDPLAETTRRWSTYNYALDNPIRFIDPDGMSAIEEMQKQDLEWGRAVLTECNSCSLGQNPKASANSNTQRIQNNLIKAGVKIHKQLQLVGKINGGDPGDTKTSVGDQKNGAIPFTGSSQQAIVNQFVKAIYDARKEGNSTINLARYFSEYSLSAKEKRTAFAALGYAVKAEGYIKATDGGSPIKVYINFGPSDNHSIIPKWPDGSQDGGKNSEGNYYFYNYNYSGSGNLNALTITGQKLDQSSRVRFDDFIYGQ